jgi:hypothetical protein
MRNTGNTGDIRLFKAHNTNEEYRRKLPRCENFSEQSPTIRALCCSCDARRFPRIQAITMESMSTLGERSVEITMTIRDESKTFLANGTCQAVMRERLRILGS